MPPPGETLNIQHSTPNAQYRSHDAGHRFGSMAGCLKLAGAVPGALFAGKSRPRPGLCAGWHPASKPRRAAGMLLAECLVYMALFALLTGIGLATFYLCWNHSQALVYATDDIGAALRAGERWRADVRQATGAITLEPSATAEQVWIPSGEKTVVYHFEAGEVRREIPALHTSDLLLPRVKSSAMTAESRSGVTAWRWELELQLRRPETQLPLLFTFKAAQSKP